MTTESVKVVTAVTAATDEPSQSASTVADSDTSNTALTPEGSTANLTRPGILLASALLSGVLSGLAGSAPPLFPVTSRRRENALESETLSYDVAPELSSRIRDIFERGATEFFEDGMDSVFS